MEAENIPYRLFPERLKYGASGRLEVEEEKSASEVVILKLHGSVDWFDKTPYERDKRFHCENDTLESLLHPIFGQRSLVNATVLTDGPRDTNDSLKNVYRVNDPLPIYSRFGSKSVPLILSPSGAKFVYAERLLDLWWGMQNHGRYSLELNIIGYSLPDYDEYARMVLYNVARNYTEYKPNLPGDDRKQSKVRIIDYRTDPCIADQLRERYRFIDSSKCEFWMDGFNKESIDWLFKQKDH